MIVTLPLIFIAVYVLFQIGLGAWLSRRVRTETDYFLGGRTLGIVVSTFSVFATWFGAESCIGTAGRVTEIGLAGARSDPLAYALCLFLMGALLAARLWQRQLTTLGDLFSERFGAGVMKLACVILVPTSILWAAAQIRAFGQMLAVASGQELSVTLYVATFAIIAYLAGRADFSAYLGIPHVPRAGELAILCAGIMGACLAFLWFNAPPAAVFMGDTGSLALGGALGAIAVASRHEIVLAIVGGLFVLETLSVMLQVAVYKRTGKRLFLMAPIHHHFEKLGWQEPTIVIRFWIIAMIFALAGLSTLKLR